MNWEDVALAPASSNAVEHLSLPCDAASRARTSSMETRWSSRSASEVEDVAADQLDGLDQAHGVGCRPPIARWSKFTFVPTASVKQTSRDIGCAASVTCIFTPNALWHRCSQVCARDQFLRT